MNSSGRIPKENRPGAAFQRGRLRALDAGTGELVWEITGLPAGGKAGQAVEECDFLGPPLPVKGKLFAMVEQEGYLCLVGLEAKTGKLLMRQRLAVPQSALPQDGGRRMQALHISYDRGVLICPTHGGAVVAYDLANGALLWAHAYRTHRLVHGPRLKGLRSARELEIESIPNLRSPWQVTAPILQQGKVIHAAADSPVVECLKMDDGTLLWKSERVTDDLFLAGVHQGTVLIIGRKQCRGLRLEDGRELWRHPLGTPSGQGIFADGAYWLPVKAQGATKGAGLVRIDVVQGTVADPLPMPGQQSPGNLVVVDGQLISQTVTAVAGYGPAQVDKKDGK